MTLDRARHSTRPRWLMAPLITALAAVLAGPAHAADQFYFINDLGTLGGASSEASGINRLGQIAGWSETAAGTTHGFIVRDSVMTDLGTLTGGTYSYATGINDNGQVAGYGGYNTWGPQFSELMNSFLWVNGSMQVLDGGFYCYCSFNERHPITAAYGLNDAAQIVGKAKTPRGGQPHAYLWQNSVATDISGGWGRFAESAAYGINGAGQVVGVQYADVTDPHGHAVLWQNGQELSLGTLPDGSSSRARAINASGRVVGEAAVAGGLATHAFLWQGDALLDLGTLPGDLSSKARGINASSQVVGESVTSDGLSSRAFLWKSGVMTDLESLLPPGSGWRLTTAAAINDAGQIVGTGVHDGQVRAFVMTPVRRASHRPRLPKLSASVGVGTMAPQMHLEPPASALRSVQR